MSSAPVALGTYPAEHISTFRRRRRRWTFAAAVVVVREVENVFHISEAARFQEVNHLLVSLFKTACTTRRRSHA